MSIKSWRFIAIILAALSLGMKLAHTLELPPKLELDADTYLAVQTNLYTLFGSIGPIFDVGAFLAVARLTLLVRQHKAFPFTLASTIAILLSLITWFLVVRPANSPILDWQSSGITPDDWMRWRAQWQYGQAATFLLELLGFTSLIYSTTHHTAELTN